MSRLLNSEEALKLLKDCYITDSVQTLRKWIREGKINASGSSYRQEGYTIKEEDLKAFIDEVNPGILEILRVYHEVIDRIPIAPIVEQKTAGTSEPEEPSFSAKEKNSLNVLIPKKPDLVSELSQEFQQQNKELTEHAERMEKEVFYYNEEVNKPTELKSRELGLVMEMLQTHQQQISELKKDTTLKEKKKHSNNKVEEKNAMELTSKDSDLVMEILQTLQRQIKELNEKVDSVSMESLNNNKKPDDKTRHKEKTKDDFIGFFKKDFWSQLPQKNRLVGDIKKKFQKEAGKCYSIFYDENGHFKDGALKCKEDDGFNLIINVDEKDISIEGKDRKELMKQYFETVFLPENKYLIAVGNNTQTQLDSEEGKGDTEEFQLSEEEMEKAET